MFYLAPSSGRPVLMAARITRTLSASTLFPIMYKFIALLILVFIGCGCQSLSNQADTAWLEDFARTDSIELRTKLHLHRGDPFSQNKANVTLLDDYRTVRVADTASINRLKQIYSSAKWQIYRTTVPASIMNQVIYLYDDQEQLRRLCCSQSGRLWEFDSSDNVRNALLSEDDQAWIKKLFDETSEPNGG